MEGSARKDDNDNNLWWIPCSVCHKDFAFRRRGPVIVYRGTSDKADETETTGLQSFYGRCENENMVDKTPCKTVYQIIYNHDTKSIKEFYKSGNADQDTFWIDIGRELIKGNLDSLDKRAEYMITTITALIVIDFGILVGFQVPALTLKVAPQMLFAISIMFFIWCLRIKKYNLESESVEDVMKRYQDIGKHKYKWQNIGFYVFVAGLAAMAITYVLDNPLNYIPEKLDTSQVIIDGKLNLTSSELPP